MARPFVFVGVAALVASFLLFWSGITAAVITFVCAAAIIIAVSMFKKHGGKKIVALTLMFFLIAIRFVTLTDFVEKVNKELYEKTVFIKGRVTNILYSSENLSRLSIKINESTEVSAEGITVIAQMFSAGSALPGDKVSAEITFNKCSDEYKTYNFANGRYFFGDIEQISVDEEGALTLWRFAYNLRAFITSAIASGTSGESGAVLKALIIGDTSGISPDFSANVKATGVSHMLVVSGMHLGIICGVLMNLLRRRTKRWVTAIFITVFVGLITLICLFHVSILRASIAYFVMLIGRAIYRRADGLSSLGLGAFAAVFLTPYIFYNVAYQLSLTATFAVICPADMLVKSISIREKSLLTRHLKFAVEILVISVSALVCTLPVVVHHFGYVALAAPVTNLLVSLAVSCALIIGVVAVAVFFIPFVGGLCSMPLFWLAEKFAAYFIIMVNFIGEKGFGVIKVAQNKNIYCFLITVAFILIVRILFRYQKTKKEVARLAQRQNP